LMLQKMPDEGGIDAVQDADAWDRVVHLTATLGAEELLASTPEQLLYRLYHEESVRLFEPRSLAFGCSCSRSRVGAMLRSLGRDEVAAALQALDRIDAEHLLSDVAAPGAPGTAH
jgi:molecular chaperone Hsp33